MAIIEAIRNMIRRKRNAVAEHEAKQMNSFLDRCENFRLLLAANHVALEGMSDMGDALGGLRQLDMNYVRSSSVSVVAAVGRMVEALCRMGPGSYDDLRPALRAIAREIDVLIHTKDTTAVEGPCVLPLAEVAGRSDLAGSKTASLALAGRELQVRTPDGFVFTADAYRLFMGQGLREEIERLCLTAETDNLAGLYTLASRINDAVLATPLPHELNRQLQAHVSNNPDTRYAVRSSALDEDMPGASFAGQYLSVLGVTAQGLADAFREVVASAFSVTAMTYRRNRGLRDDKIVMCVACMEMVDARAGGVMYTRDPLNKDARCAQIHAVVGLPVSIVDGGCDPDTWTVDLDPPKIVSSSLAQKTVARRCHQAEGTLVESLTAEQAKTPAIDEQTVLELARMGQDLENLFDCPQDTEWAIDENGITLLQCRPLEIQAPATDEAKAPAEGAIMQGGTTASPGTAAGPAHVVKSEADLLCLPTGAVMVTAQAHPAWASAMDRVSAIVAEHGSIAGHLANIAREFHVPAVFGLEKAVQTLGPLDEITVDASVCAVYPGRRATTQDTESSAQSLLADSPVMLCLREVMDLIIPLNLIDASSPDFAPKNCTTLHDITRFCHELGVTEMFNKPGAIPTGAARRLVTDVPTQYWVLDMGGGLINWDRGAVSLDDVCSTPMLALWEGMHAKAWQGPPPPDAGGFMSVVMQATANPALAAGAANEMGNRNYFIIDQFYCNLQSRFGFHFSTVEGHASPFADENYAYLQFKGGGADPARRRLRAEIVRNILAHRGFLATAKDDAVFARMENITAEQVLQGMVILGHIIVHTRQLDMVMRNADTARHYETRLQEELDEILQASSRSLAAQGAQDCDNTHCGQGGPS